MLMLGELIDLAERAYKPTPEPDTDNTGVGIFSPNAQFYPGNLNGKIVTN